ncbi:MAG: S49 family peptidase, partial [Streptosporangiaceae bacterium]
TQRRRTAPLVLEADLTGPLVEGVPHGSLAAAAAFRKPTLRETITALRRAGRDPRVRGLVVKLGGTQAMSLPRAEELREAVAAFRADGKPAIAWAETFGEFGPGNGAYYLATGFDQIWLQPSGDVGLTGIALAQFFLAGAFEQADAKVQYSQRYEYKNAANVFTEHGFTDAHREAAGRVVTSATDQLITGIAEARGLTATDVRGVVDRAPLTAADARDAHLIDRVGYRDEVYAAVRAVTGDDAQLLFLHKYGKPRVRQAGRKAVGAGRDAIGLVHVTGGIHLGRSDGTSPFAPRSAGADTVTAALRDAVRSPDVRAIVLRVDSGGGSYAASDTIWRAVARARAAGKTVVASMGQAAASGGYYVAMGAHAVVAEPTTLTGSIGVLGGKIVLDRVLGRAGISRDAITEGEHALMFSSLFEYDDADRRRLEDWLDRVYVDFTAKVAESRHIDPERVHELARGRVWTGADAHERGLVDELGGLTHALEVAKRHAGIPASADTDLRVLPHATPVNRLLPAKSSEDPGAAAARLRVSGWGVFAGLTARLGLPAYGPLSLPGDWRLC